MLIQAMYKRLPAKMSDSMGTRMVVQRLAIRAATGKLKIISIWRCLAQSDVRILRWNVCSDRHDGIESMTVDLIEADGRSAEDIADILGKEPLEMTVTVIKLTVISTPETANDARRETAHNTLDPRRIIRSDLGPTVLGNTTSHLSLVARD
jgi:hypothetical protein